MPDSQLKDYRPFHGIEQLVFHENVCFQLVNRYVFAYSLVARLNVFENVQQFGKKYYKRVPSICE